LIVNGPASPANPVDSSIVNVHVPSGLVPLAVEKGVEGNPNPPKKVAIS